MKLMLGVIAAICGVLAAGPALAVTHSVHTDYKAASQVDSTEKPSSQAADSGCCGGSVIEGKNIIPGQKLDSLATVHNAEIRKPSPSGALLRSLVIPGWGQLYNKKYIKAALYGGTEIYLIYYVRWRWKLMDEHQWNFQHTDDAEYKAEQFSLYEKTRDSRNLHMWLTGLVVLVSMFDAYVDAQLAGFDQQDKAFQVYVAPHNDRVQLSLVYNF